MGIRKTARLIGTDNAAVTRIAAEMRGLTDLENWLAGNEASGVTRAREISFVNEVPYAAGKCA
jgi:hypothetical protein